VLLCAVAVASAAGPQAPTFPRERPDDPPAAPAQPLPGATPTPPVTLGPYQSVQVNVAAGGANIPLDAANETTIAVDPTDPNNMVIAWRQFDSVYSNFREAGWAYTHDGGRTWTFGGVLENGVFRSDPVLGVDAAGNFYYNSLTLIGGTTLQCDVFKSTDGGESWLSPVFAYGGDKQWMAIDRSGGIGDGHVYQAWSTEQNTYGSNTFTRSTDGAASFSTPSSIPDTPVWGTMDVGPDGTLWVAGVSPSYPYIFYVAKSTNAQDAMASPTFTTTTVDLGGSIVGFDGPNPQGLLGQVYIAVDPSNGNVYVLCSVRPPGFDPVDVHFVRSTDGGVTWSAPLRVNDDVGNWWNWFGTMSVAPNGRIDVVWNDTRHSNGYVDLCETYYSYSTDAGMTWATSVPLTPQWDSSLGWPNQQKIGDYYHMVSDDVGAHLAYAATFNGEEDVWYLRIGDYDCNSNGVADSVDIATGTSHDWNRNDIPDECEPPFDIPTLSGWGLLLTLFLLVSVAAVTLRHRAC